MKEEMITISMSEYKELVQRDNWLSCLEDAGVDNWIGYDFAIELRSELYPEEEEE